MLETLYSVIQEVLSEYVPRRKQTKRLKTGKIPKNLTRRRRINNILLRISSPARKQKLK